MKLAFLNYQSRSGSTFLARLLDDYSGIGVSLEARLPDGIRRPSMVLATPNDVDGFLDKIYTDPKFAAWNLDRHRLRELLVAYRFPCRSEALLPVILSAALAHPEVALYKSGSFTLHRARVERLYPDSLMLHIIRDCRGIFASQKRSARSGDGESMSGNPILTAMEFNAFSQAINGWKTTPNFCLVRYEELVGDTEKVLQNVVAFLGMTQAKRTGKTSYAKKIPAAQRHLHTNVAQDGDMARIDSWKSELSASEIGAIECLCGTSLTRQGYGLSKLSISAKCSGFLSHCLTLVRSAKDRRRFLKLLIHGP